MMPAENFIKSVKIPSLKMKQGNKYKVRKSSYNWNVLSKDYHCLRKET